jgi:5-methylcytosine-specific restriction enzyme A
LGELRERADSGCRKPSLLLQLELRRAGKVVVLNLWLDNMREQGGRIVHEANYRADAEASRAERRLPQAQTRGFALDQALQTALKEDLPVRVIINSGERRERDDAENEASRVHTRSLDPFEWTIAKYDWKTGACTLVRGRHVAARG